MLPSAQVTEADLWQPGFSARTAKLFAQAAVEKSTARDLSLVVPCFNEEAGLPELHRRITASCQEMGNYEVILVNDGSRDSSWSLMCQLADADPHLVVINLSRNHGHQFALTAGLTLSQAFYALRVDARELCGVP
jgi:cellulose synthase/poly-beta-1,6-N-acetylglucosamine synthase-like glycosyltransferase